MHSAKRGNTLCIPSDKDVFMLERAFLGGMSSTLFGYSRKESAVNPCRIRVYGYSFNLIASVKGWRSSRTASTAKTSTLSTRHLTGSNILKQQWQKKPYRSVKVFSADFVCEIAIKANSFCNTPR